MKTFLSFILTAKNKKNKPLKNWPIETTAGFYADRLTDASCIIKNDNLAIYEALPTLYVEPTKNTTECIFESCDNQSENDLEVDENEGIYFFPGGEASCPVADFSRSWFEIDEMNSEGWKMNIKINGIETNQPKLVNQAVLLRLIKNSECLVW